MVKRVHVHGAGGRMGTTCTEAIRSAQDLLLCGTSGRTDDLADALQRSRPDVVVEFTVPSAAARHLDTILEHGAHAVSGTTGVPRAVAQDLGASAADRGLGMLLVPNFSIGAVLVQRFAAAAARWFADVEILELHHERKLDAPSGTALDTARRIARAAQRPLNAGRPDERESISGVRGGSEGDVRIHSIRLPGLLAHQVVLFGGVGEVLTLRHDTSDRRAYIPGILLGVRAVDRFRGLVDSLEPLLDEISP